MEDPTRVGARVGDGTRDLGSSVPEVYCSEGGVWGTGDFGRGSSGGGGCGPGTVSFEDPNHVSANGEPQTSLEFDRRRGRSGLGLGLEEVWEKEGGSSPTVSD